MYTVAVHVYGYRCRHPKGDIHPMRKAIVSNTIILFLCLAAISCGTGESEPESAITLEPGGGPVVFEKIQVTDSRVVRGFRGTPVDGTLRSFDFRGYFSEYPDSLSEGFDASSGIDYAWNDNDGLHIRLADDRGYDAIVMRGGASTRMYAGFEGLTEPDDIGPSATFGVPGTLEVKRFANRMVMDGASFYDVGEGDIADLAFFRILDGKPSGTAETWRPTGASADIPEPDRIFAPESIRRALDSLHVAEDRTVLALSRDDGGGTVAVEAGRAVHFLTSPVSGDTGLGAVGVSFRTEGGSSGFSCTAVMHDPLDPSLELVWLPFKGTEDGDYHFILDFPDQVLAAGDRVWVTLTFDTALTLTGQDGSPAIDVYTTDAASAMPEALVHRKFLLKTFFALLSECRPWGSRRGQPRDEFFSINRYTALLPQLFMTIDRCHMLAPDDDMVRQYREWVFLNSLDELSDIRPPDPPDGAPDWAWYPRMTWLEVRDIVDWWIEHRKVPTGEFGGKVSDDSDLYQQFADLPYLESGGVARKVLDGAARLAELTDRDHIEDGLNLLTCDTLHAYEEGINHMALMARWFYGDPIYMERCMESARNMEKLTYVTDDGRRHFRDRRAMGHIDLTEPHEPSVDGHATTLMWHTALQTADYNRNPLALRNVREWADSWLLFQKPGQWATEVEVLTGRVLASSENRPLYGGYRTQATVFSWLYGLTGEAKYLEPFMYYHRQGEAPAPSDNFLSDSYSTGLLESLPDATVDRLAGSNSLLEVFVNNDESDLIGDALGDPRPRSAVIANLHDMSRWPMMYTSAEQFTDRLFINILKNASLAHLGGYTQRNKFNPTMAVSWSGFGTDYGALVTENRPDGFSVLVYNFAGEPVDGKMQVWNLEHGTYRITTRIDTDGDKRADEIAVTETRELMKADSLPVTLQPGVVTAITVEQVEKLDPIFTRPDLALADREMKVSGRTVTGVVHNIGSSSVSEVIVALVDGTGKEAARTSLGALDAPLDLVARKARFSIEADTDPDGSWSVIVDPDGAVAEIYEGNNTASLGEPWPPDYSNGWE